MTKFTLRSDDVSVKPVAYESFVWRESSIWPGVRFQLLRMSLMRRLRLMQELKNSAPEAAFHRAQGEVGDEIAAWELQAGIDERVLRTALVCIEGLDIDGRAATVDSLIESGPEGLAREIAEAIADESSLGDEQRKN